MLPSVAEDARDNVRSFFFFFLFFFSFVVVVVGLMSSDAKEHIRDKQ